MEITPFHRRAHGSRRSFLTLVLTACLAGAEEVAARAQLSRTPQVAVLDLDYLPMGRTRTIPGRQATDAVMNEMTRTGQWDVLPRSPVQQQLEVLDFTPPLRPTEVQRFGQALGAEFVLSGAVTEASLVNNGNQARVTLRLLLTDTGSGEYVNGAVATGVVHRASLRLSNDTAPEQTLLFSALEDAAFRAIRTINDYHLPTATVLQTTRDSVRLNQGMRGGVRVGQEFVILRHGLRIGKVRVTWVGPDHCDCAIVDLGRGIRPEDRARAVFDPRDLYRRTP